MSTLGQQLKAARQAKGISESEAGSATKILTKMIVAMEEDDFSLMAAPTYAKGFIRLYADYLGLDPAPLIEEYNLKHNSGPRRLRDDSQLEKSSGPRQPVADRLDHLPPFADPRVWAKLVTKGLSQGFKRLPIGPFKDIRIVAATVASILVLGALISAVSTCARNREPPQEATISAREIAPAPTLLDETLPNLYLIEPGKIEAN
jgi:hypothetical protein